MNKAFCIFNDIVVIDRIRVNRFLNPPRPQRCRFSTRTLTDFVITCMCQDMQRIFFQLRESIHLLHFREFELEIRRIVRRFNGKFVFTCLNSQIGWFLLFLLVDQRICVLLKFICLMQVTLI